MSNYIIDGARFSDEDSDYDAFLGVLYEAKLRPSCPCIPDNPPEMYLAKIDSGKIIVKRMPNSGHLHDAGCEHFIPPAELSGLGAVLGSAIQEGLDGGLTGLKFNFSLKKMPGRAASSGEPTEKDSVKADTNKLTLRGTLHYLWEEAGFNKWSPSMAGKRNWFVIRKHLMQAAVGKIAKQASLGDLMYIPEPYHVDQAAQMEKRRLQLTARAAGAEGGHKTLMIVIGEVKDIADSRYGKKIVAKHLPDFHFMITDKLHKQMTKNFDNELALWEALPNAHLMFIGTFWISPTGYANLEEISLMPVTENWIPVDSNYEKRAIETFAAQNRRFVKGLRYNMPSSKPMACAILSDVQPPVALYVIPPGASDSFLEISDEMIAGSKMGSLIWRVGEDFPVLPPATGLIQ